MKIIFFIFASFFIFTNQVNAKSSIENFRLLDHQGRSHELYYYSDMKGIVLIWQGNGCPIVRHSIGYLNKLQKEYRKQGVQFFMINANLQDDRFSIQEEVEKFGIEMPILEDRAQIITADLGIERTATAMLVDPENWEIIYQGAIHDRLGYETQKKEVKNHYLRDAIDAHLKGKLIKKATQPVKGCLINIEQKTNPQKYTYTKDIAPVFIEKCLDCHSPDGVAPWSMDNYKTVKGWATMIREVIRTKRMPPIQPDPYYGEFQDDDTLLPEEKRAILGWIEQGLPRGEGEDLLEKAPRLDHTEWVLGEPDLILDFPEHTLPATGLIPYQYSYPQQEIQEDVWLRAVILKPSNSKTVHHATVFAMPAQDLGQDPSEWLYDKDRGEYTIAVTHPGRVILEFPKDTAIFIQKGSKIFLESHYIATGKPEKNKTQLGLYFPLDKPKSILFGKRLDDHDFKIPPGEKEYEVSVTEKIQNNILVYGFQPHMHYRGKYMKFEAEYPDGTSEVLLSVPHYQFAWQTAYLLKKPKTFLLGTRITCVGAFDNSPQRRDNPDSTREVVWGSQSSDEMFIGSIFYTNLDRPFEILDSQLLSIERKSSG